jgi:carboxypeptidase Q
MVTRVATRLLSLRTALGACGALLLGATPLGAGAQSVDLTATDRIVNEGGRHSEVMGIAGYLTDEIGQRLTNSPGHRKAIAWTQDRFRGWGLTSVRTEGFPFGHGWWMEHLSVRMIAPRPLQLTAGPISWSPGTNGPITAPIIFAPMTSEAEFAQWKGKLAGRIVLVSPPDGAKSVMAYSRQSPDDLAKMDVHALPRPSSDGSAGWKRNFAFPRALQAFLKTEGALALIRIPRADGKLIQGDGARFAPGDEMPLPGVEVAAEDYRRLVRLAERGSAPTLQLNLAVQFDESDHQAYNVLADIAGTDPKAAYVMAGAHLDSVTPGDGAADNAAGVAMVMEAARILSTMPRPRRTIRFALWGGEEQGEFGSINYVERHFATRGDPSDPQLTGEAKYLRWWYRWPIVPLPSWHEMSVYFNLDNGAGKIRGIFADNNLAAIPIFREWFKPFESMGASTVAILGQGGSDNDAMQDVGVPGYQFIQDWDDYGRMHHTSLDTYDHLEPDDMRQASIILASFLWNAANMKQDFPRRPLPTKSK